MRIVVLLLALGGTVTVGPSARAALTVFDPANLAQNLATAARTLQSNIHEAQQIANQLSSLSNEALHLEVLPLTLRLELIEAIQALEVVIQSARGIAFDYRQIQQAFDEFFPGRPTYVVSTGAELAARHAQWAEQTLLAVNDALSAQGLVADIENDRATLNTLVEASTNAPGVLSATQATNELAAVSAAQLMRLEHILAGSLRAQSIAIAMQASEAQAAQAQLLRLGETWGERRIMSPPSETAYLNPLQ